MPRRRAAETLGSALRDVGYSESGVHELLGEEAYSRGEGAILVLDGHAE